MSIDTRPTVKFPPLRREHGDAPLLTIPIRRVAEAAHVGTLRQLARDGELSAAAADPARRSELGSAAFAIGWPVVYNRLTRGLEIKRGHGACASSVLHMEADCLDNFYDDVEAVIDYVLAHASKPIDNIEAWIASRLRAATVDGHRRRRGLRGALQRPRLPNWLSDRLGGDPWLATLATQILVWVGVNATAGTGLWPLESWTARRVSITGDAAGSSISVVAADVEVVLAAMRTRPAWFAEYVEKPLGHKRAPVGYPDSGDHPPLLFAERADIDDTNLVALAAAALAAIEAGLVAGADAATVVTDVIITTFGGKAGSTGADDIHFPPFAVAHTDEWVNGMVSDPEQITRVVAAVLEILG